MTSIENLVEELSSNPGREAVASEIQVLQSIYGDDAIRPWVPGSGSPNDNVKNNGMIRYEAHILLLAPYEDIGIRVLVSLPSAYPESSPPQLQLLSRYVGAFSADSQLFGSILRTFISTNGVEWTAENVCVFDGLQHVIEKVTAWYEERLNSEKANDLLREDTTKAGSSSLDSHISTPTAGPIFIEEDIPLPEGIEIIQAEPIQDRKSVFVGRACRITHPSQVPLILSHLLSDKRIARAAHPTIHAWRCKVGDVLHQDNDDDGETAAGGRIAHLLQILDVLDVLVVVTRYFGGIHLGPDRFKHINQAARNALEQAGLLEETRPMDRKTAKAKR